MTGGPLARLARAHARLWRLCDATEALADSLPRPRRADCLTVAMGLREIGPHRAEEGLALFPLLRLRCAGDELARRALRQLDAEHRHDEGEETELQELLGDLAAGRTPSMGPEGAGYELRAFFEAKRRHMGWEEIHVLPLARCVLSRSDLDLLDGAMRRARGGARTARSALLQGV